MGMDDGPPLTADAQAASADDASGAEPADPTDKATETRTVEPPWPRLISTPDYDEAVSEFCRTAIHSTMAEMDPNYGALRRLPMPEGVSSISVQVAGTDTPSPHVEMSHLVKVERDDVVNGNLEKFHEIIWSVADGHLQTLMPALWGHVANAVSAVGNNIDLSGEKLSWDKILDMYEQIQWMPNDQGMVQMPMMQMGTEARKVFDALPEPTAEQQGRMQKIAQAKQEAHVSRRRSRRLRGELD